MSFATIAKLVPDFVEDGLGLAKGPAGFLAGLEFGTREVLERALRFFLVALVLAFVLGLPFADAGGDLWTRVAITMTVQGLAVVALAGLAAAAWRLVGLRIDFRVHLIVALHVAAVAIVLGAAASLLTKGIVAVRAPDFLPTFVEYMDLRLAGAPTDDERFAALEQVPAIQAAIGAYLLGQILVLGWFAFAWNAWRRIGGASPARAIVAFALFVAFAVPCVLLLAAAQHGAELPLF